MSSRRVFVVAVGLILAASFVVATRPRFASKIQTIFESKRKTAASAPSDAPKKEPSSPKLPPIAVRTAVATSGDVETLRRFRGFTSVEPIKVVPRVRGALESVEFVPGEIVREGDVLFRVESFDYRNAVDAARDDLEIAAAREAQVKAQHERNLRMKNDPTVRGLVAEETVESTRAAWQAAIAATAKAKTALELAEKQLERTVIRAPSRGQIGRSLLPIGTLVDGTALAPPVLTTIVEMNPMRVYFYATDREYLEFQRQKREELKSSLGTRYDERNYDEFALTEVLAAEGLDSFVEFEVGVPGLDPDGVYSRRGVVNYVDNVFDRSTGVVALRGEIPNADYSVYPGVVCNVRVRDKTLRDATLINVEAVCNDLNSQFVWLVDDQNRPRRQPVVLGRKTDDGRQIVVEKGVRPGDRYVVDGALKIRPGAPLVEAPEPEAELREPQNLPKTPILSKS